MNYGEIVSLGRHRLMCGDATKVEDVKKLIAGEKVDLALTDPPYGMKTQHKDGRVGGGSLSIYNPISGTMKRYAPKSYPLIIGDDSQETARKHYEIIKGTADKIIMWGGQYFAHFLPISGAWIFWHKKNGNSDFSDGELAWVSHGRRVRYYEQRWNGMIMAGSCELNGRGKTSRLHPTQKPVELHMNILEDYSKENAVILDCFGGSGTTLIACEMTGRKCLMMEISPEYCDIIKERYEKTTQQLLIFNEVK